LSFVDPYGLFELPVLPQGVVDATAGFGDAMSFGITYEIREALRINDSVNACSIQYKGGFISGMAVHVIGFRAGAELRIGKNWRIAPWGNRTGHPAGELPHYHRRGKLGPDGNPLPGEGMSRHRPWEGL
jgi:hypothetical protein